MSQTAEHAAGGQLDLFDHLNPGSAPGSDTSAAAAKTMKPRASRLRESVLEFLRRRGSLGATDEEIAEHLNMRYQTAAPRRWELWKAGLVLKSTQRRLTTSGCSAAVWIAVGPTAPWTAGGGDADG